MLTLINSNKFKWERICGGFVNCGIFDGSAENPFLGLKSKNEWTDRSPEIDTIR